MIRARLLVGLAERFGCLPSQVLQEDAEVLRMVRLVDMVREAQGTDE